MKAVIFDGAREDDIAVSAVETALVTQLEEAGWTVDSIALRNEKIAGCLGCFGCWIKTPGMCVIDDYGRETAKKAIQSDLLVWLTPVTFGGYSSELKKALDRLIPILLPYFIIYHGRIHHKMRYKKQPKLLVIGTQSTNEEYQETFLTLTERNVLNLRPPKHAAGIIDTDGNSENASSFVEGLLRQVEVVS